MLLLANIFSGIGTFLLAYSTFSNKKDKMLYIQVGDTLFNAIGNLIVGSYSAMNTNLICTFRNILNAKNKNNKYINVIILLLIICIGLLVNKKGIIGIFPIIASVEYTLCSYYFKSSQSLRYALIVNLLIWFIHDMCMLLYPAMFVDLLIIIVTIRNSVKYKNKQMNNTNNKNKKGKIYEKRC